LGYIFTHSKNVKLSLLKEEKESTMFISFLFQAFLIMLIFVFGRLAYMEFKEGDYGHCKVAVICAAVCYVTFAIFRLIRKRVANKTAKALANTVPIDRIPKHVGDALIAAHKDLQNRGFRCCQCRQTFPIDKADRIDIEHYEEEVETSDGDLRRKTFHRYSGLICDRCSELLRVIPTSEHTYASIPDEFRKQKQQGEE
jgi:hypothetical protein